MLEGRMAVLLARRTLLFALPGLLAACDLPRDPEGTSRRVENGVLRVGVAPNPPWTETSGAEIGGVEAEAVRGFAQTLHAGPDWVPGAESRLLQALERFELDLVIGGLTQDTPWRERVGITRPYLTVKTVLGIAAGEPAPASLDGMRVAIQRGDPAAARLRARGAEPVWVDRLARGQAPAAVEDWKLSALRLQDSGIRLRQAQHVMAVPSGENAFLLRLERFLLPRGAAIREGLQDAAG